ncbi:HEPN domain-containing protein [Natronorarus salvus]|uniref:hypothetical protein n=1 Tax=Natronorarus salvus TaxID=3117733 RepID=UPI002F263560
MLSNRRLVLAGSVLIVGVCLLGAFGAVGVADPSNETTEHEHPDEAEVEGNESAVSQWLRDRLDDRLGESSVLLSERQYDGARDAVGEEYDELLGRYAEVEDSEDEETEDEERRTAEEFEEAVENQRNLTDDVEAYERTYEEYQDAVEDGDGDRARDLARDLDELAASIEERADRADDEYDRIEEETGRDTSAERESVENIRSEIDSQHSEVREREFVETELSVDGDPTEISFREPMTLSGTVQTVEGEPVTNEPIALEIEGQRLSTTTTATGSFSVPYRPTVLPLDASALEVEYVPERGSPYVGSNATVPVSVEQVDSTTEVTENTESAAFGDDLMVNGTVSADDVAVDAVPVVLVVDGEEYDRTETTQNGTFTVNTTVPANVPSGDADVRVLTDLEDQALSNSEAIVPVSITETQSDLEVRVEPTGEDGAIIAGELSTTAGEALPNQTIEIDVEGARTEVRTTDEGTFERTITLPDEPTATVTVTYADPGSNIEDAEVSMTLDLNDGDGAGSLDGLLDSYGIPVSGDTLLLSALVAVMGVALAVGISRRRASRGTEDEIEGENELPGATGVTTNAQAIRALLLAARKRLRAGETDRAIQSAYAAARLALGRGPSEAMTHWEFYQTCLAEGLSEKEIDCLKSLTTRYETAVYAPYSTPTDVADEAIGDAERFAES